MPHSFAGMDATAQAELVRSGSATPVELADAAIDAIEQLDPTINAVVHERFTEALAEAERVDRDSPFAGVPMLIKNLDGTLAGHPWDGGCRHLADAGFVPTETSWIFERLQRAGFVILGSTNAPEFGLVTSTEPRLHGPTRNPWNTDHSVGGSSGGSGAAVAAGMVSVAHAGDGGGSIRIPASMCGLVGLKPSRARCTLGPVDSESWAGLVTPGMLTRTVRDSAAILDVMSGAGPGDPYAAPALSRPLVAELSDGARELRIGVLDEFPEDLDVHPEFIRMAQRAGEILAGAGHRVRPLTPPMLGDPAVSAQATTDFLTAFGVWVARTLATVGEWTGDDVTEHGVEPGTWAIAEMGRTTSGLDYATAVDGLRRLARDVGVWWEAEIDVLITPTVPAPAPVLGQFTSTTEEPLNGLMHSAAQTGWVAPFNITGQPALSMPAGRTAEGLPIGVQLVGALGREDHLIALGALLESELGDDRRPPVWAG